MKKSELCLTTSHMLARINLNKTDRKSPHKMLLTRLKRKFHLKSHSSICSKSHFWKSSSARLRAMQRKHLLRVT